MGRRGCGRKLTKRPCLLAFRPSSYSHAVPMWLGAVCHPAHPAGAIAGDLGPPCPSVRRQRAPWAPLAEEAERQLPAAAAWSMPAARTRHSAPRTAELRPCALQRPGRPAEARSAHAPRTQPPSQVQRPWPGQGAAHGCSPHAATRPLSGLCRGLRQSCAWKVGPASLSPSALTKSVPY